MLLPAVLAGVFSGRWIVHRLPQRVFDVLLIAFAVLAAMRLIFSSSLIRRDSRSSKSSKQERQEGQEKVMFLVWIPGLADCSILRTARITRPPTELNATKNKSLLYCSCSPPVKALGSGSCRYPYLHAPL